MLIDHLDVAEARAVLARGFSPKYGYYFGPADVALRGGLNNS